MKKIKNKKTLIILLILCIGFIGITIAYFSNSTILDNLFSTKTYGTTYTETFVSPDNWLPGDTTDKTVVVTNSGQVDEAVRISYIESWISNNGNTLSGLIDNNGKLTDIEENSEKAAIINFSNSDDWTYDDGYYYYNYKLSPSESTSSFIESVTFNPKVTLGDTCQETESNGVKTVTCSSSGDDYDNATYKLTLTIETVQYNKYKEAWSLNNTVAIANISKTLPTACIYQPGDEITFHGIQYYVMKNSDDYVVVLKKEPLTADEVNTYSTDYVSEEGEYPYYKSDSCYQIGQPWVSNYSLETSGCITDYSQSDIKNIIDNWMQDFDSDLVEIDGYKSRLISLDDLSILGYKNFRCEPWECYIDRGEDLYKWIFQNKYEYWTMNVDEREDYSILNIRTSYTNEEYMPDGYFVAYTSVEYGTLPKIRPVLNIKKSAIQSKCPNHIISKYNMGEKITYNNDEYCVIKNSEEALDYVTLLKTEPLTYDELNEYNNGYEIGIDNMDNNIGIMSYYKSDTCYYNSYFDYKTSGCKKNYKDSFIYSLVTKWSNSFIGDLKEINGYKTRLITNEELENMGHSFSYISTGTIGGTMSEYDCLYGDTDYWTMSTIGDSSYEKDVVSKIKNNNRPKAISDMYAVRPVINLKKCAITNACE